MSLFDLPHSNPYGVILYALSEQLPGVKLSVDMILVSPSQLSLFMIILL